MELEKYDAEGVVSRFKFVKSLRWQGEVKIYRNTEDGSHIAISRADTFDRGDETMIFPYSLENDEVIDWDALYAGYGVGHEKALSKYEASL